MPGCDKEEKSDSASTTLWGWTESLVSRQGLTPGVASHQGAHFTKTEAGGWNCPQGIMAHMTYQRSVWPLERRDGLLQRQREHGLGDDALGRWGANPKVVVFAFNWRPPRGLCSTHGSSNSGMEAGARLPLITPNAPRGDYPDPAELGSARLENLVPMEGVFLPEDAGGPGCCQGPLGFLRLGLWMRENSPPGQEELTLTGGRREGCPVGARR